jgi:hypothetical protein
MPVRCNLFRRKRRIISHIISHTNKLTLGNLRGLQFNNRHLL